MKVESLSCVRLFVTPWTVAYNAPPSVRFSRQEYWRGMPYPPLGDLPDPGIEAGSPAVSRIVGRLFTIGATRTLDLRSSDQFSSVAQLCPIHCNPMNHSTPGLPVHHHLPEFTQIHIHRVSDAIQPSSVVSFSSCPQSLPASESFPVSQLFS